MAMEKKRNRNLMEEDQAQAKDYGDRMGSGLSTEKILHLILEAVLDIREMLENLVDSGIKSKQ